VLDVDDLLGQAGTVYLLGAEDGTTAPLVAALTAEIAHHARMTAVGLPGGRLDPPLTIALDEAAMVCPVPLDRWSADMGGRGITIHVSIQSRAQLRQRWGDTGAAAILNNAATLLIYGGTRDPAVIERWAGGGVIRMVYWLPPAERGEVERALDTITGFIAEYRGG